MINANNIHDHSGKFNDTNPLIFTVKNLCRVCYTCVRECPVKAIKIINGQAEVIPERCIACGNCVSVCSQGAKTYYKSSEGVKNLILSNSVTIACIAPSFPAEFSEFSDYRILVGMLRELGFNFVTEVSFGADLVAEEYRKIFDNQDTMSVITSDCPAIVSYIEKYHPNLTEFLAPVVSPAMAHAKVLRKIYGDDAKLVFIGPCIAKKAESDEFDESLTFTELKMLFYEKAIYPDKVKPSEFDKPYSGKGAVFPVNHGLIKSIGRNEGLGEGEVVTAEGKTKFKEAIHEFENGILRNQHLELLCCDGCIQGPGMTLKGNQLKKRLRVNQYVNQKLDKLDPALWEKDMERFSVLDLSRAFYPNEIKTIKPERDKIDEVHRSMGKKEKSDFLNCGACGYESCEQYAVAVVEELAETEMCLPYAIEKLHNSVEELNVSNYKLADTRQALKQSEKLASMGQVSAGIAHELNNPLGIITLYSSILKEEIDENNPIFEDIKMIEEQAARCKNIVGGLLNFARKNQVRLSEINLPEFIFKSVKSVVVPENISVEIINELKVPIVKLDPEQMIQALTNLEKNAVEAMPNGGKLTISMSDVNGHVKIEIADTGIGIKKENLEKIFTPFFTTKEIGKGTGLGLPLVYGIIKMHKGKINVKSNTDSSLGETGTTFIITIPK